MLIHVVHFIQLIFCSMQFLIILDIMQSPVVITTADAFMSTFFCILSDNLYCKRFQFLPCVDNCIVTCFIVDFIILMILLIIITLIGATVLTAWVVQIRLLAS